MAEFIHKELSESIIGAAMTVLNTLKPGLIEKLYERALVIELEKRGHRVDQQKEFPPLSVGLLHVARSRCLRATSGNSLFWHR